PAAHVLAGLREGAAQRGRDALRRLLAPILLALRFHHALLLQELPTEPGQRGDGDQRKQDEDEKEDLWRPEPLRKWHDIHDCTRRKQSRRVTFWSDRFTRSAGAWRN